MKWTILSAKTDAARSPPSRGAWIEITEFVSVATTVLVAPLAGGVD